MKATVLTQKILTERAKQQGFLASNRISNPWNIILGALEYLKVALAMISNYKSHRYGFPTCTACKLGHKSPKAKISVIFCIQLDEFDWGFGTLTI